MKIFIIVIGLFVMVMSLAMMVKPKAIIDLLMKSLDEIWLHIAASAVRIALGIVLILYADHSRFPLALSILGWISLSAFLALFPAAWVWLVIKVRSPNSEVASSEGLSSVGSHGWLDRSIWALVGGAAFRDERFPIAYFILGE